MTTDLPDPHACPHCGYAGLAERWGETICGMCNAPRSNAEPGCPVRSAVIDAQMRIIAKSTKLIEAQMRDLDAAHKRLGIADETAREREVHGGGPRVVG